MHLIGTITKTPFSRWEIFISEWTLSLNSVSTLSNNSETWKFPEHVNHLYDQIYINFVLAWDPVDAVSGFMSEPMNKLSTSWYYFSLV